MKVFKNNLKVDLIWLCVGFRALMSFIRDANIWGSDLASATHCIMLQHTATHWLQLTATHYNTMHHTATQICEAQTLRLQRQVIREWMYVCLRSLMIRARVAQVALCCGVSHCVAVCCNVTHCVAVCYTVLHCVCLLPIAHDLCPRRSGCSVSHCIALCCSVSQCVLLCCSVYTVFYSVAMCCSILHYLALCCTVSRYVVVRYTVLNCVCLSPITHDSCPCLSDCSVLQCVVVSCSVFQCAVVRCSVLQHVTVCCRVF